DRGLRIWNAENLRRHVGGNIEDRQRLVLIEAPRQGDAVVLVVDELLLQRVAYAEIDAAENLAVQAARVDDRADVGHRQIVDDARLARLDVHFHFSEADDERPRIAVMWIRILRDAHQPESCERG